MNLSGLLIAVKSIFFIQQRPDISTTVVPAICRAFCRADADITKAEYGRSGEIFTIGINQDLIARPARIAEHQFGGIGLISRSRTNRHNSIEIDSDG